MCFACRCDCGGRRDFAGRVGSGCTDGIRVANGVSLNAMTLNLAGQNGVAGNTAASQGFDFNNVSVRRVTWTDVCGTGWLVGDKDVACGIETSPGEP